MLAQRLIFAGGLLVTLMPYLGFPGSWKTFFYVVLGLMLMGVSFVIKDMRRIIKLRSPKKETDSSFVESSPAPSLPKKRVMRKIQPVKDMTTSEIVRKEKQVIV